MNMTPSKIPQRHVLEDEEISALLETADASTEQNFLLMALPLDTGLRIDEIANLRADSIRDDWLDVSGKIGDHSVPVTPRLGAWLQSLADENGVIWQNRRGEPMTTDALRRVYRRLFDWAGISGTPRSAATLRSTFAIKFLQAGGNKEALVEIMGHSLVSGGMKMTYRDVANAPPEILPPEGSRAIFRASLIQGAQQVSRPSPTAAPGRCAPGSPAPCG